MGLGARASLVRRAPARHVVAIAAVMPKALSALHVGIFAKPRPASLYNDMFKGESRTLAFFEARKLLLEQLVLRHRLNVLHLDGNFRLSHEEDAQHVIGQVEQPKASHAAAAIRRPITSPSPQQPAQHGPLRSSKAPPLLRAIAQSQSRRPRARTYTAARVRTPCDPSV